MRKLLPFLLLSCLFGCHSEPSVEIEDTSTLETSTKTMVRDEVHISMLDTTQALFTNLFHDEFQDKPDMLFFGPEQERWSITVPSQDSIRILGGDPMISFFYEITLHRGDSLRIAIDTLQVTADKTLQYPMFELLHASKSWAELNFNYLLYKKNLSTDAYGFQAKGQRLGLGRDSDLILANGLFLLDSLAGQGQVSRSFYNKRSRKLQLDHAREKIYAAQNQQAELSLEDFSVNLNEDAWASDKDYLTYLRTVVLFKYFRGERRVKNARQFDWVADQASFLTPKLRLALLDSYLKSIYFVEKSQFKSYLEKLQAIDSNKIYTPKWESLVAEKAATQELAKVSRGQEDRMQPLLGDEARTFAEALAAEKGKVILVDFWASWCVPCRKEMPAVQTLQEKRGKNNLAVVRISIDKKLEAWKRAAKMEGIEQEEHNYIITNWESSELYQRYQIKTIPRYLLFDPEGHLLEDDAPRPSDTELLDLIRRHI